MVCPQLGSCLRVALAVPGVKVAWARRRRWHGTGEPVAPIPAASRYGRTWPAGREEGGLQAAETV